MTPIFLDKVHKHKFSSFLYSSMVFYQNILSQDFEKSVYFAATYFHDTSLLKMEIQHIFCSDSFLKFPKYFYFAVTEFATITESRLVFYRLGLKRFWIIFASACLSWHAFFLIVPTCFKFLHFGLALGWHCFGVSFVTCLHDYSVILQHSSARNIIFWEICFKRLKKRKIIPIYFKL